MTESMAAADNCEHHYQSRILGGHPLHVSACYFCRQPDWDDLDEQALELYRWGWTEGRTGKTPREALSAYDKPREASGGELLGRNGDSGSQAGTGDPELTAQEARDLADDLGLQLYRAQDALAFVEECCVIADREQKPITTADVRDWLKGARCGRKLAADARTATEAIETAKTTRVFAALHQSAEQDVSRVIALYEQWVKAGPPPLGVLINRWWDARLVELHEAILPPQEQP